MINVTLSKHFLIGTCDVIFVITHLKVPLPFFDKISGTTIKNKKTIIPHIKWQKSLENPGFF